MLKSVVVIWARARMSPNAPKEKDREDIVRSQTETVLAKEMWALERKGFQDVQRIYISENQSVATA